MGDDSMTVEGGSSNPFNSSLSALFILHRTLGSVDESASEAEQYDKVLYYYPAKHPVGRQLQLVSLVEGLIDFSGRFAEEGEEPIQVVNLKKRCLCFYACEDLDVWLVAVLREPTGVVGDGSDSFSVNTAAVRTLLRLMYQTFVLFHGTVAKALSMTRPDEEGSGGWEAIDRVKDVRKEIRKNEIKRSMVEGGYEDDDEEEEEEGGQPLSNGDEGRVEQEANGNGKKRSAATEAKLGELDAAKEVLEGQLEEALRASPATTVKRQLQAFMQVYLAGVDFENMHLVENMPGFHMAPAAHGLQHSLTDLFPRTSRRALLGMSLLMDGHLISYTGLSREEMLLIYTYFKFRDLAQVVTTAQQQGPSSSLPTSSPPRPHATPDGVFSAPFPPPPPPPHLEQTLAAALDVHSRKTSGIIGKLSGLAHRLKGAGGSEDAVGEEDKSQTGLPTGPSSRGFLAEDGLRYLSLGGSNQTPRLWLPRLHPLKAEGSTEAITRRLAVYASDRLMVLLVLQEDQLPKDEETGRPCMDKHILVGLAAEIESSLTPDMLTAVPPSERLAPPPGTRNTSSSSSLPSGTEMSRFIYYNRINGSFFTSQRTLALAGLQNWSPSTLFLLKHRHTALTPLALAALNEFNNQFRELSWGDREGEEGPFREVSMRTREDGWVIARQSCGREIYALVDPRLSSILDAQEAFASIIHHCFGNVHVP